MQIEPLQQIKCTVLSTFRTKKSQLISFDIIETSFSTGGSRESSVRVQILARFWLDIGNAKTQKQKNQNQNPFPFMSLMIHTSPYHQLISTNNDV
jgi:hypothetical protein